MMTPVEKHTTFRFILTVNLNFQCQKLSLKMLKLNPITERLLQLTVVTNVKNYLDETAYQFRNKLYTS